jgi:peptide chain release factor subunit 1
MVPTKNRYSSKRAAARMGGRARSSKSRKDDMLAALAELLERSGTSDWTVTCYQKLEPADRNGEKYRIKLKNRLRRTAERLDILGLGHAEREAVRKALAAIEDFFQHPENLDGGRGIAVFAGPKYFKAVTLPYVLKSRILVDRTPVVGELVHLSESRHRVLAVAMDRRSARFFDVWFNTVTELTGLFAPATRPARFHPERDDAPGVGEYRFHTRIREEKHRHMARIAEAVSARLRAERYDALLIGGTSAEEQALTRYLSPAVTDRIAIGHVTLPAKQVTPAEIAAHAAEFLDREAARRVERDLAAFTEARGTGWAVDGVEATLEALHRGQVAALLVDHDAEMPGYRLSKSGRLTTEPAASRSEGEPVPVADVLDDAIEDALRQRARVAVVRGTPAKRFARLAGMLRFQTTP